MSAINKVTLLGRLGKDPELKHTAAGLPVSTFSIATSESWKDKQTGEKVEKTEWHRVVIYDKLAEIAARYLRKGSQAYLEGKIQTRKWTDQSGQEKSIVEIVCKELVMLDKPPEQTRREPTEDEWGQPLTPLPPKPIEGAPRRQPPPPQKKAAPQPVDDFVDDDVPF